MAVLRIVPNIDMSDPAEATAFWCDIIGLRTMMDMDWILTHGAETTAQPMVSVMSEGGSGTSVPSLSVEVDNLDAVLERAQAAGLSPEYGPVTEPWGVRRFYLRDPAGTLVNVLTHN